MNFKTHGDYTIVKHNHFFVITYIGAWNIEICHIFLMDLIQILKKEKFEKFGLIIDFRRWEGSTPEALLEAEKSILELYNLGYVLGAHINVSPVKQQLIQPLVNLLSQNICIQQFNSYKEAIVWMDETIPNYL